ncbi:T9SS type A sorting domain-containing protein [Lutibacter oricola]|nr:T9SS type A sorting domain-containing protein [Lutibacter oricola]
MKQNYFVLLTICIFYLQSVRCQIANEGTLQINNSTTVYFGAEYTNNSGGIHNCHGDLYLNSNFINNGITSANSGTTIFSSSSNLIQTISGDSDTFNFYNLTINQTAVNNKGVLVSDNIGVLVKNAVNLTDGDLRLAGESQLVQTHTGTSLNTSVSGKLHIDQQGYASAYGYNHWSSPVNNGGVFIFNSALYDGTDADLNPFDSQQVLFNSGSPYNGLPSVIDGSGNVTTPLTVNTTWLYKFSRGGTNDYGSWIKLDETSDLVPGEGYLMKGTNTTDPTQNYVFRGTPNDGDYSFPVGPDESNLFGNPYPSSLDAKKFIEDNISVFDGTLTFWVEGGSPSHYLSDYVGGYATRNLTTGVSASVSPLGAGFGSADNSVPTQFIAVGQGFFINTDAEGTVDFKNSQRSYKSEALGETIHYRTSEEQNSFIRIGYEDPEGFHRQIALGFLPGSVADLNYNQGYDALISDEREDELFFVIENDLSKKYVIQGVGEYRSTYEFDLGLIMTEEGSHTIMLDGVENFNDDVFIKDEELGIVYDLNEENYNVLLSPGSYLNRFKLVFINSGTLNVNDIEQKSLNVFFNSIDKKITILNPNYKNISNLNIFNSVGQNVMSRFISNNISDRIELPFNVSEGIYYVKIIVNGKEESYKILNL